MFTEAVICLRVAPWGNIFCMFTRAAQARNEQGKSGRSVSSPTLAGVPEAVQQKRRRTGKLCF